MKNVPRKALFCKAILLAWDLAGVVLEMLEELEKLKDETPSEARSKVIDAQLLIAKALKLLDEAHKDVWA